MREACSTISHNDKRTRNQRLWQYSHNTTANNSWKKRNYNLGLQRLSISRRISCPLPEGVLMRVNEAEYYANDGHQRPSDEWEFTDVAFCCFCLVGNQTFEQGRFLKFCIVAVISKNITFVKFLAFILWDHGISGVKINEKNNNCDCFSFIIAISQCNMSRVTFSRWYSKAFLLNGLFIFNLHNLLDFVKVAP